MHTNIFERLSFLSLFLVVVLLPVFCLPFMNISVETSKGLLLVVGLTACVFFWAIDRFYDGKIIFPKSGLLLSGLGIVLAFLLSTIVSGSSQISLFGIMFDIGSFYFIFAGFILMFFSSIVFKNLKRAKMVMLGVITSSIIVVIFQIFHLFFPKILSLGILDGVTGNIIGSWNALGIFAGFVSLLFLLMIEFFTISNIKKIIFSIFILLSILLMSAINFPLVWILLGIFSTIIFVYKVSVTLEKEGGGEGIAKTRYFPMVSFAVMMISLLFFISSGSLGNVVPNRLQISNTEVSPSFSTTMFITKNVLIQNPIFGIGPNKFREAWSMYKPLSINDTQFWNVSFNSGSGLFTTMSATTGGVGILSLAIFFILFFFIGTKSVFASIKKKINWEMVSFFILSLYLLISSLFYFTGPVVFLLFFAFTGIFIGLNSSDSKKEFCVSFLNDHRKSFFSISALIILIVFFITVAFKYSERFISVFYFEKALSAQSVPDAKNFIGKAISLYSNDLYLRTYSQIYLVDLNSLLSKGEALSDADNATLQTSFDQALKSAQLAIIFDSKNYLNYQLLGSIYQTAGVLGVKDAYNKAVEAYQLASSLNVNNSELKLSLANIFIADNKNKEAKDYANSALALKPDYINALLVLSQISKSEGDDVSELSYAQKALAISPMDTDLIKYVDSLKKGVSAINPVPPAKDLKSKKP